MPSEWMRRRMDPAQRYGLRTSLVAVALILVAIPFTTLLLAVIDESPVSRFDQRTAESLNEIVADRPGWVTVLKSLSFLGKPPTLAAFILLGVGYVLLKHHRRLAVFLVVTSLGGGIVDTLVKIAVNRPRPDVANPVASALGKSFPSGHAMSSTVVYGALLLVFQAAVPKRLRPISVAATGLLVLAIGGSRLFLGVHFVSDVLGGYVLGSAWLIASVATFETWRVDEGKPTSQPLIEGIAPEAGADLTPRGRADGRGLSNKHRLVAAEPHHFGYERSYLSAEPFVRITAQAMQIVVESD